MAGLWGCGAELHTQANAAGDTSYTVDNLQAELTNVLQPRAGIYSNRPLGGADNLDKWDAVHYASLLRGMQVAHQFYAQPSLPTLVHLILAELAAESSGDYTAMGGSAVGVLQVTPSTVQADYVHHGLTLQAFDGATVMDPQGSIDLTDPGENVALWAWSTRTSVTAGESADEIAANMHRKTTVTRDFGNAHLAWLAGPGYDRHSLDPNSSIGQAYKDYHDRIEDYFVQSGWGTAASFEALLGTPVGSSLVLFRDAPAGFKP